MRTISLIGAVMCALLTSAPVARADESAPDAPRAMALGFQLDLLPTVLSAVNGEFGYAPQVWVGIGHVRLRLVGSHLEPPNAFAFAPHGFEHPTTTAFAAIIDYTFGREFDGFWVGSGFELWNNSIEHVDVAGTARWNSTVFTVGGGYIVRFARNFYVDPWAGAHLVMNPQTVTLGGFEYEPAAVQGEVSVKLGVMVPL